ncbi:phosphoribosylaminoimidazolesuccinocarboxamide synthase [bacterium]|nr:phosphoribosylaminoimidazolesuccinocarboxamide synthase [bacterium]
MSETTAGVHSTRIPDLELLHQGKVRDVYALDDERLVIVATDRLSAFDVILPDPITGKGEILTQVSNFWFGRLPAEVPHHLTGDALPDVVPASYAQRAVVAKRLKPLPVEAIVRGYIIGSGWKDYQRDGAVCGITLPPGFRQADQLPTPIFTPSTKASVGDHDENVGFDHVVDLIGADYAEQIRDRTLAIYKDAAAYARQCGIIIADTKLEFGVDEAGTLHVIDELLTPDSSRFWPVDQYLPGSSPPSFDKQYVRDYLETLDWDKTAPGPSLPTTVISNTVAKYREALTRLTG